jgi:hypothetical protein
MIMLAVTNGELPNVSYVGPHNGRPHLVAIVDVLSALPGGQFAASPALLRLFARRTHDAIRASNAGLRLLSEENLLGSINDALRSTKGIYSQACRRLRIVKSLLGNEPVRVVLTVRDYGDWFISAYSWKAVYEPMPGIESLAENWARLPRRWTDVVSDVITVFGNCTVVPFERIRDGDRHAVARELIGPTVEKLAPLHLADSLGASALRHVQQTRGYRARGFKGLATVNRLKGQFKDDARFAPFSEQQLKDFHAKYACDLGRIQKMGATVA